MQLAAKDCGLAAFRICQGAGDRFLQLIQVCFGQHNLTDYAVIRKLAVDRRAGIRVLVVCQPGAVGRIGAACLLGFAINLHRHGPVRRFHQNAALVFGQDVGVVGGIVQCDRAAVAGQAQVIRPLDEVAAAGPRLCGVGPVAKIASRGLGLDNQELAVIGIVRQLGIQIENLMVAGRPVVVGGVGAGVAEGVLKVELPGFGQRPIRVQTGDGVAVIPGPLDRIVGAYLVHAAGCVPLVQRKLGVRRDGLPGLTVGLVDDHPVAPGAVAVGVCPQVLHNLVGLVDDKFDAPRPGPVLGGGRVAVGRRRFLDLELAEVVLGIVDAALLPAGVAVVGDRHRIGAIGQPHNAIIGADRIVARSL